MLVDPVIVPRPGVNGTPSGGCEFCGGSHPNYGGYACYLGKFYCSNCAAALANSLGLLVRDDAQRLFERLTDEVVVAKAAVDSSSAEAAEAHNALAVESEARVAAESEVQRLTDELAHTKTYSDRIAEYLAEKPKKTLAKAAA